MKPVECANALRKPVGRAGGAWMLAPETYERAAEIGVNPDLDYYIGGRLGVLGNTPDDVAVSAAVFIAPQLVAAALRRVRLVADPLEVSAHFARACHDWGRAHLPDGPATATVISDGGHVVAAASNSAAPLFAGWRAQPRPADAPAAAALVLHQLRELRMARHAVAITVVGLTPLEAIIAGPGGEGAAQFLGWEPPYPDPAPLRDRRDEAERLTDEMMGHDLLALPGARRSALAEAAVALAGSL